MSRAGGDATIAVYNGNLARLSHLYTLTHWVENGLRSQLDLHYGATLGAAWHCLPDQYLPRDSPANFPSLHASMGVESRDVLWSNPGRRRKEIIATVGYCFPNELHVGQKCAW